MASRPSPGRKLPSICHQRRNFEVTLTWQLHGREAFVSPPACHGGRVGWSKAGTFKCLLKVEHCLAKGLNWFGCKLMAVSTNKMTRLARFWQTKSQTIIPKKHQLTKQHRLGYKKLLNRNHPQSFQENTHPSHFQIFQKSQPIQPWPLRSLTLQAPPSCLSGAVRDDPEKPSFPSSEPGTVFSRPRLIHEKRSQNGLNFLRHHFSTFFAHFYRWTWSTSASRCMRIHKHTHTLERPHVAVGFRTLLSNWEKFPGRPYVAVIHMGIHGWFLA